MLHELPASQGTTQTDKMLAITYQWEMGSECYTDNTRKFVFLINLKLVLDAATFYLCCRKPYTSFLNMCSLSIVLADLVLSCSLAASWYLGAEICFLLANASGAYGALALPIMLLGFVDYWLEDTYVCINSSFSKYLRNAALVFLGWMLAVIYSVTHVKTDLVLLQYEGLIKVVVCQVQESTFITYFILVLFTAGICATLPFLKSIPRWLKEADRISEMREEQENQQSDLMFLSNNCTDTLISDDNCPEETVHPRPPLWFSLSLGFLVFWMSYMIISVGCMLFGLGVPAYMTVNVLWLECTNSLLMGVVLWAKSNTPGSYRHLPENVCSWHIYWRLSQGTTEQQLPISVLNPSKGKKAALLYV